MTNKKKQKNKTGNEKIWGIASLNKIASQRSLCTVCTSRKSIFLKQRHLKQSSKILKPKIYM